MKYKLTQDQLNELWKCKACLVVKPKYDFYPHSYNKSGVTGLCKECYRANMLKRQQEHRAKLAAWRTSQGLSPEPESPTSNSQAGKPRPKRSAGWEPQPEQPVEAQPATGDVPPSFVELFKLK